VPPINSNVDLSRTACYCEDVRIVILASLLGVAACRQPRPPPPTQPPPPQPTAAQTAVAPVTTEAPPVTIEPEPGERFPVLLHPDFEGLMLFRDDIAETGDQSLVVSARLHSGSGASCLKAGTHVRCIDFAGYTANHVGELLRKGERPPVAAPAWAMTVFELAEAASDLHEIEVLPGDAGPLLMVHELDAVRFAFRTERGWLLSSQKSGGKITRPFYFGSLDTSRAVGTPSLGIIIGSYWKESCLRSETVELVVLELKEDALEDLGSVVIGRGNWLALDPSFGPFNPKDPNHYRIQLRPRVQHDGKVRFELESRHTPKQLRNRKHACGIELSMREIDAVTKLIGSHRLADVFETEPVE
jgi:hypothetical protein